MACDIALALLALVLLPSCLFLSPTLGDTWLDFSTTLSGMKAVNACGNVNCGHGQCVDQTTDVIISSYSCDCSEGWAKPLNWPWVPCVIPNCTIRTSCNNHSSSRAPSIVSPAASPPTHACFLPVCGNGKCVPGVDIFSYTCECDPGYANLFNSSTGLCLTQCQIGSDCSSLGISIQGNSSNMASPDASPSSSQGFRWQLWHGNYALTLVESLAWLALVGY
eukprot:c20872_g1_i1 orf=326-988(-)